MSEHQQATNSARDGRKTFRTLELVDHGHFTEVVKDAAPTEGSQIVDTDIATGTD